MASHLESFSSDALRILRREALRRRPLDELLHNDIGAILQMQHRLDESLTHFN
jgi:hypothetical protein